MRPPSISVTLEGGGVCLITIKLMVIRDAVTHRLAKDLIELFMVLFLVFEVEVNGLSGVSVSRQVLFLV